jgi:trimeric autotransporter adhesin
MFMKLNYKNYVLSLLFCLPFLTNAQVGINTTTPNSQLDIRSSNQATPANTDGILIPKIDTFPATNPTVAQQGMLVYLAMVSGSNQPGFYYWNNVTATWLPITGTSVGTLDQAYDFGGAGLGRTITADAGAVLINGTDGLVSTGTFGSGVTAPAGVGTKMFWNPRKSAFRAGFVAGTQWNDASIGDRSIAFGLSTIASGATSTAFGSSTIASDTFSTAFGNGTAANGNTSTAFGNSTIASGSNATAYGDDTSAGGNASTAFGFTTSASGTYSTAFGNQTTASGTNSTALGRQHAAPSFGETVLGIGATTYTPSVNGATQFRAANASDRLFVIGNAIDSNNTSSVDATERSDAMVVLKNGLTRLPSTTNAMITAADGKAVVTKEYLQSNTSGTLDQAYDFGGAGLGGTITADAGAVLINGTDGLISTGTFGSGAILPISGAGAKMFWYPRKAAFRAGAVSGTQWDDVNIGNNSIAFGVNSLANGLYSTAFGSTTTANNSYATSFGDSTIASGITSTAFGNASIANGQNSTAFGDSTIASGMASTAFGESTTANANTSTAFGLDATASGTTATAFGNSTIASGQIATAFGNQTTASGLGSTAFGYGNTASSYGETVIGIGATIYTPSTNGTTQFRTANATDRLFVIGNAIDVNNNSGADATERSDAMVVLKNGNTGIGSSAPQDKLHVVGNIRMVDGNQAAGKILTSDANGTATWQNFNPTNSWNLTGNTGTNSSTNFMGTTDDVDVVFKRNNIQSGLLNSLNTSFGMSALNPVSTGIQITAFGRGALAANTTGNFNTASGYNSLASNTTGISNTAMGNSTLNSNTTGTRNVAVGSVALFDNTIGTDNVAIGVSALNNSTIGIQNTAVGENALITNTTGNSNIGIGYNADVSLGALTNAIAIGTNAQVNTNNSMVLGSINGVNGATATVNVGIGTSAPQTRLDVMDENAVTSITDDGNLLVRTINDQGIDIGGSITLGGMIDNFGTIPRNFASIEGRKETNVQNTSTGYLMFKTNNAGSLTEKMRITSFGDVGIGTTTPGGQFELTLNEGRKPGSTTWTVVSDSRLKTVDGLYTKGLTEIVKLQPIRYHYKNNEKRKFEQEVLDTEFSGFIAQEVQPLFSDAVQVDEDGYLSFNMHSILVASINAIKELNAKITKLEQNQSETEKLKQQIELQQQINSNLEERLKKIEEKLK